MVVPNIFACNVGKRKFVIEISSQETEEKVEFQAENFYENQLINFVKMLKNEIEIIPYETVKRTVYISERIHKKAYDKVN